MFRYRAGYIRSGGATGAIATNNMERAPRANPHDKYICTFYPGRLQDGTFVDGFDYCNWRIPDEATYGEFFICFVGQHEIGDGNIFFPIPIILSIFFFQKPNETISNVLSRHNAVSDINKLPTVSVSDQTKSTTSQSIARQKKRGITAPIKSLPANWRTGKTIATRNQSPRDTDVISGSSDSDLSMEGREGDEDSDSRSSLYSTPSEQGSPISISSSIQSSDESPSCTPQAIDGLNKFSRLPGTSRASGSNEMSASSTVPPVLVNLQKSGVSANALGGLFGLLPSVPPELGKCSWHRATPGD